MSLQILAAFGTVSQSLHDSENFFDGVPRGWPHQHDLLTWCQQMTPAVSAMLIIIGMIYLLFGFQIFQALVLVNAAVVGAYVGAYWGKEGDAETIGAVICAVTAAAIAWPTMKYAVAIMGGFFGALLGASIWHALELDPNVDLGRGNGRFDRLRHALVRPLPRQRDDVHQPAGGVHAGLWNSGADLINTRTPPSR